MEQHEIIRIRASQQGMSVVCDAQASLTDLVSALQARLAPGARFYAGADIRVDVGDRDLDRADFDRIRAVLEGEFNLRISELVCSRDALVRRAVRELECDVAVHPSALPRVRPEPPSQPPREPQASHEDRPDPEERPDTVIIRHTCRSGASVRSPGNIVIIGNVNPGADVIAQHDIIVAGVLRGNAHAGAGGDTSSVIMALALEPKQLRIADKLGLPPSGERPLDRSRPVFAPEIAYIEGDRIMVEPYTGRFPGT